MFANANENSYITLGSGYKMYRETLNDWHYANRKNFFYQRNADLLADIGDRNSIKIFRIRLRELCRNRNG